MANRDKAPDWIQDAIFYQIFPDRFANGDPKNDGPDAQPWDTEPTGDNRMGGDLAGVEQHLDYLQDLGINALYFNPLFQARSNHGYDTTDYHRIDRRFGTNAQFAQFVSHLHKIGWHVILDGVFNHTGIDFKPFQSVLKEGELSPYKDWFHIQGFPIRVQDQDSNYESWNGTPWLPKLNLGNPDTRAYLLDVATRWIKNAKIDGWRLDAADQVPHEFWKEFRNAVRESDSEAYLIGEIWDDASPWLQGDEFCGVMNYRWRGAAYTFFCGSETTPTAFDGELAAMRASVDPATVYAMLNMLSSHDADRLATRCHHNPQSVGQCVLFQFTYPGVPCIYYGDEIGMEGEADPDNRRTMLWDESRWDVGLRDFHKRLIALYHKHTVLRRGDYETILLHDENRLFGFRRQWEDEAAFALFNTSDAAQCAIIPRSVIGDAPLHDWLGTGIELMDDGDNVQIGLPPHGMALLGRREP